MSKPHLLVVCSLGALLVWLFAPALDGGQSFVFRDSAHYYHPLFEFIRDQWAAGQAPLWNPYDNLGMPLVAENTSSIFYPGKLIFALPLDYTLLYNLYVVGHVALAALAGFCLARHLGATIIAAGMGAVSYAFCGNVLFNYCNVVFLVGAAWLPLALLCAERMLTERRWQAAVWFGVVLALMILGGDPQMAYNAGLLAALYAVILWRQRKLCRSDLVSDAEVSSGTARPVALLCLAAVVCLLVAAVQILPTLEASRLSARGIYDSPRSVYELAEFAVRRGNDGQAFQRSWYSGLLNQAPDGHQRQIYQFSVGPWRAIEYLWPNVGGLPFPTFRRWGNVLPGEGRMWVPSFYMGLLPLLLALVTWSVRRTATVETRWLSWMAALGALGSLGVYGLAWLVREITVACGGSDVPIVGDEVGGLYWLLTVVLPGYVYFRYPAKLLVIASLALSMLAARGFDDVRGTPDKRLRNLLLAVLVVSVAVLALVTTCWSWWAPKLEAIPADPLFGPFDSAAARQDVVGGLKQTIFLSTVFLAIFWRSRSSWRWAPAGCLLLTIVDLGIASAPLVPLAPRDAWYRTPLALSALAPMRQMALAPNVPSGVRPRFEDELRTYRFSHAGPSSPESWRRQSSVDRMLEVQRGERNWLLPKYHLPYQIPLVEASATLAPYEYQMLLTVARAHNPTMTDEPDASILDLLGVQHVLQRSSAPASPATEPAVLIAQRTIALPRARIVHKLEVLGELHDRGISAILRRTEEVLFPLGQPRDWRRMAVVESDDAVPAVTEPPPGSGLESCEITHSEPVRVEIRATLASPGLVVLSDLSYPGWELTVETDGVSKELPILRTNRVMRGAWLPAGDHRLTFRYRPKSVLWGAGTSVLSTCAVAAGLLLFGRRKRSRRLAPPLAEV